MNLFSKKNHHSTFVSNSNSTSSIDITQLATAEIEQNSAESENPIAEIDYSEFTNTSTKKPISLPASEKIEERINENSLFVLAPSFAYSDETPDDNTEARKKGAVVGFSVIAFMLALIGFFYFAIITIPLALIFGIIGAVIALNQERKGITLGVVAAILALIQIFIVLARFNGLIR